MNWLLPIVACVVSLMPAPAHAWNSRGHMVIAGIAWQQMTPVARARAAALLKRNPQYADWIRNVPTGKRARYAFVKAATWPDQIRGMVCTSSSVGVCYRDEGYTPADADADLDIGYADHRLRRYWHFKDIPFSPDGTPTEDPFRSNAENQIERMAASLDDPALGSDAKSFNLSWLLHLVGDVHQPLHATSRFTSALPDGDNGGNRVKVCLPSANVCDHEHAASLHGFWDDAIGTSKNIASAINKANAMPAAPADSALDAPPADWLSESFELAKSVVYAEPISNGPGPTRLTMAYRVKTGTTAEQRVIIAGERLAKLLNRRLH